MEISQSMQCTQTKTLGALPLPHSSLHCELVRVFFKPLTSTSYSKVFSSYFTPRASRRVSSAEVQSREIRVPRCSGLLNRQSLCGAKGLRKSVQAVQGSDGKSSGGAKDTSWHTLPPATEEVLQYLGINAEGDSVGFQRDDVSNESDEISHDRTSGYRPGLQVQEGYVGLFVRLLGLDNSVEERENAVLALWRHSMGTMDSVKEIVMYPGCLNLIVSLLPSERQATAEAAAGLLRNICAIEEYRCLVTDAGAVEEIAGLLTRRTLPPEVKEQALCVLWNVSSDESERKKIAELELLPVLLSAVGSHEEAEREAAVGVLANMSRSPCNQSILVEAGIISKLAKLLLEDTNSSKVFRQGARNTLLQLAKDFDQRVAIIEEGLVPVPLIGASAYRSFKPLLEVAPSLPEDIKLGESQSPVESVFGAGELLLGLKAGDDAHEIDRATRLTIEGRVRQQFLARIGVIEREGRGSKLEPERASPPDIAEDKFTLMPWWEGVPRLVLILGLEDLTVVRKAAEALAQIAINEDLRQAIHKAGAVPHLVRLLGCGDEAATEATALALDMLGKSQKVRRSIDAHGAVPALVEILRASDVPQSAKDRVVSTLLTLSQQEEEVEALIQAGAIPGLMDIVGSNSASVDAKEEAEEILEEISTLKPDSRDKIVAAGGIPPLIEVLATGTTSQAEKAAYVLENLATEEGNAEAMVTAGIEAALVSRLDLNFEDDDSVDEDTWGLIIATSKLLEKLVKCENLGRTLGCAQFASLLTTILRSSTAPLYVKNWVSPCLWRLQQRTAGTTISNVPTGLEITTHDSIPRLVEAIGEASPPEARESAAIELRDLASQGVGAYLAAISTAGGIFPLVNLLESGSPDARSAALAVLYNLGMDEENHPAMLSASAIPSLERLVKRGIPDWKLALYLLRTLPT